MTAVFPNAFDDELMGAPFTTSAGITAIIKTTKIIPGMLSMDTCKWKLPDLYKHETDA